MTDTIEHGRLQAAESLAADIASFDFGTNTGKALELAQVSSPEELAQKFPDIAQKVFPTDPRTGEILAYRPPLIDSHQVAKRVVTEVNPSSVVTDTFQSSIVNERENVLEDPFTRQGPFVVEETGITPTITGKLSNKQKAAGLGILAAVLFL